MMRVVLLTSLAAFALSAAPPACQADPETGPPGGVASDRAIWRANALCGNNCLYVMLRMKSKAVDYNEIAGLLADKGPNVSLADLKRLSHRYGLWCEMGKGGRKELEELAKPVIAHLEPLRPDDAIKGHYVLVLAVDEKHVSYLDGTTAVISEMEWRPFLKRWSGYFLFTPDRDTSLPAMDGILTLCGGLICGGLIDRFVLRRLRR